MSWILDHKYSLLLFLVAAAVLISITVVFALEQQEPILTQTQLKSLLQTHLIFLGKLQEFANLSDPDLNRLSTIGNPQNSTSKIDIPLYYINLQRNPARNSIMLEQLQKYNVPDYTRIEQADPTMPYTNKTVDHLRCAKTAYDANLPYVMIIEDDASLDLMPFWSHSISEYIHNAPPDWTILQLFSDYPYDKLSFDKTYHLAEDNARSTLGYIVNRKGMENLIKQAWNDNKFVLSEDISDDYCIYQVSEQNKRYLINLPLLIPGNMDILDKRLNIASRILNLYTTQEIEKLTITPNLALFQTLANPKMIYENPEPPTQVDIVMAYFKADFSWLLPVLATLKRDQYRLIVYSKGKQDHTRFLPYIHKWIELENIGRCDHSYVYHILNQSNPSKNTFFVKDAANRQMSPDWLVKHLEEKTVNGPILLSVDPNLSNFTLKQYNMSHDQQKNVDQFVRAPLSQNNFSRWAAAVLNNRGFQTSSIQSCLYGGIFICPSSFFENTSKDNWTRIGCSLSYGGNLETGHFQERLWYHVLSTKNP